MATAAVLYIKKYTAIDWLNENKLEVLLWHTFKIQTNHNLNNRWKAVYLLIF